MEDFYFNKGGSLPPDYYDLLLCQEWGISWREYWETPYKVRGRMLEFNKAKYSGMERRERVEENKRKLKTLQSK